MDNKVRKVKLNLVRLSGNAHAIIMAFSNQARKEGWSEREINEVVDESTSGDYDHLLATFIGRCE